MGAVMVLATVALAAPVVLLGRSPAGPIDSPVGQVPSSMVDPTPELSPADHGEIVWRGPLVDTGFTVDAPNRGTSFDVLLGLMGPGNQLGFVIALRDQHTGEVQPWINTDASRSPQGDFSGKHPGDETHQFVSGQLALGSHDVLDMGIYSGDAARVTVASEGRATNASTAVNTQTGWTFFWVERDAAPLPEDALAGPAEYTGPERLTITAYSGKGQVLHTVTGGFHIGSPVQTPSDDATIPSDSTAAPDGPIVVPSATPAP
jgi:hypothetical protein